jgi:hypothetical protein
VNVTIKDGTLSLHSTIQKIGPGKFRLNSGIVVSVSCEPEGIVDRLREWFRPGTLEAEADLAMHRCAWDRGLTILPPACGGRLEA